MFLRNYFLLKQIYTTATVKNNIKKHFLHKSTIYLQAHSIIRSLGRNKIDQYKSKAPNSLSSPYTD